MAYVKLKNEDVYGPRMAKLAALLAAPLSEAVGRVALFLAAAEMAIVEAGTASELLRFDVSPSGNATLEAMLKVGLLKRLEGDVLQIAPLEGIVARKRKRQEDGRLAQAKRGQKQARPKALAKPKVEATSEQKQAAALAFEAYAKSYAERTGELPTRNAKTNRLLQELVRRLGVEEAPHVAAFYVTHNSAFYAERLWPLDLLVRDCEGLRTQWARGQAVTREDVRNLARSQSYFDQLRRIEESTL